MILERVYPGGTLRIECGSQREVRFPDVLPDELEGGLSSAELRPAHLVVCAFEEGEVLMTPELMQRVRQARQRLGRPLTADDIRALDRAEGAVDDDA